MTELKPPLTYEEQISRLIDTHNLTIDDKEKAFIILKKVSYYRLSAYGIGLTYDDNREKYIKGISLEHLYNLYQFDSSFRNLLIHVIEQLEIQLRTQISNHLALKYGAEGYVDKNNFNDKKMKNGDSIHTSILKSFQKECQHQKNAPFVKHHMNKYQGHFPIWVAVELFTFGNLSSLYSIMKKEDRKEIAKLYNTEPKYLGSWILALVEVRNICAHYSRLYNMPLKQTPHLYSECQQYRQTSLNKIFPVLLTLKRMIGDDELWKNFKDGLESLIGNYYNIVKLSFIGFPENWQSVLFTDN